MEYISRISVTCFAASYAVGMIHELLRIYSSQRWVRWVATGATLAGVLAHTLFLVARGVYAHRLPIATHFESLVSISWILSVLYLTLLLLDRRLGVGLFVQPLSLGLVLYAAAFTDPSLRSAEDTTKLLPLAHGLLLLAGTVLVVAALVSAFMYLVKVRQLRSGWMLGSIRLPSLERLDRINLVAVYLAWTFFSLGIALGFLMRSIRWTDPKVLVTVVAWSVFTILVNFRYHPENRGRRMALLTIAACALVLVSVLGDPLFGTAHQAAPGARP